MTSEMWLLMERGWLNDCTTPKLSANYHPKMVVIKELKQQKVAKGCYSIEDGKSSYFFIPQIY